MYTALTEDERIARWQKLCSEEGGEIMVHEGEVYLVREKNGVYWAYDGGVGVGRASGPIEAIHDCMAYSGKAIRVTRLGPGIAIPGKASEAVVARPKQSRRASLIEAIVSTAIGFVLSYVAQSILFRLYGIPISHAVNLQIVGVLTVISIFRGYYIRRMWESSWWTKFKGAEQ